jgi:outer membrane protein
MGARWSWVMRICLESSIGLFFFMSVTPMLCGCAHQEGITVKEEPPLPQDRLVARWQESCTKPASLPNKGKLTLDQAIEEALRASPELHQMEERAKAAKEQIKQAEASFYPRLILSEEFNVTDNPVFALMNIINQRRLQTDVNFNNPGQQQNFGTRIKSEWSLFEGGSSWHKRKASLYGWRAAGAEFTAASNRLVAEVTETYYRWLQALGFIGVAEQAVEAAKTDERLAESRLQQEMALPSEIMRLKARTAEAKGNLVTAQTGARRFQAALERLLARPISSEEVPLPSPPPSLSFQQDIGKDPEALVKEAMEKRPEMKEVRFMIQAARERVRSAQGGLLPRLGASAFYGWDSEDLNGGSDSWMVGIGATWPLFEGGLTVSTIREAKRRLKELEARGEQVALDIALEVHQAVLAVKEAAEKIQAAEERRKWAQKALDEVRQLYRNQVVTVDSLLQAEVSWSQAEVSYTAALFEGMIAQALLRKSLGDFADWVEQQSSL